MPDVHRRVRVIDTCILSASQNYWLIGKLLDHISLN
jgi:hypothetical protein